MANKTVPNATDETRKPTPQDGLSRSSPELEARSTLAKDRDELSDGYDAEEELFDSGISLPDQEEDQREAARIPRPQ